MPSKRSVGVLPGAAMATTSDVGAAPIAAMSAIEASAARRPICSPVAQSVRKWTRLDEHVDTHHHPPVGRGHHSGVVTRADRGVGSCGWSLVTAAIRANSPIAARVPAVGTFDLPWVLPDLPDAVPDWCCRAVLISHLRIGAGRIPDRCRD